MLLEMPKSKVKTDSPASLCGKKKKFPLKQLLFFFCSIVIVGLVGVLNLFETFWGDQALFVVYAAEMNNGLLLYRDIWDLKQPGIFLFYLIGGKLFGFSEFGIHLFELLYWLTFSAVLLLTLKEYFRNVVFLYLTPLLTIGVYYAVCGSMHLTQVEGLVGFPLYVTLWASVRSLQAKSKINRFRLLCLSGLAGGVVLIFKFVLFPIFAVFWLTALVYYFIQEKDFWWKTLFRTVFAVFLGMTISLGVLVAYFSWNEGLSIIYYTFFQYPGEAVKAFTGANRISILKEGLGWFLTSFFPLILLIALGGFIGLTKVKKNKLSLRKLAFRLRKNDLLTINFFLWIIIGLGVIFMQLMSWWEYHYLLILVPLGVLASKSIEVIWEQATSINSFVAKPLGQTILTFCIIMLFTPTLYQTARKIKHTVVVRIEGSEEKLWMPSGDVSKRYELIRNEVAFLSKKDSSHAGRIFVCGQPLYYYLSDRSPALSSNGWMPEFFLQKQWTKLNQEITSKRPSYIVVESYCQNLIAKNSPEIMKLLRKNYKLRNAGENEVAVYESQYRLNQSLK